MGLRLKIGLVIVGSVAVLQFLASYFRVEAEREVIREELVERGGALLQVLALPYGIALANNDNSTLNTYIANFVGSQDALDVEFLSVLDGNHRVVAHTDASLFGRQLYEQWLGQQGQGQGQEPKWRLHFAGSQEILEIAVPVVSGLRGGTLVAGFSLVGSEAKLEGRKTQAILSGLGVAVLACIVAFKVLSVMVLNPVLQMQQMAQRFVDGIHDVRVIEYPRDDELGELAKQLNSMADEVQMYTASLENLLVTRTTELVDSNLKLGDANARLEELARRDPLTGLSNRRHFMEQLQVEIARGYRVPHSFTLILLDVDYFKHYNDTHGHPAGDALLVRLGEVLQGCFRPTDIVGRYGGEEFVVMLLDTPPEEGSLVAERLRKTVDEIEFAHEGSQPNGKLTISAGVSFYPSDGGKVLDLLEYADQALYVSKNSGRNLVTFWPEIVEQEQGQDPKHS